MTIPELEGLKGGRKQKFNRENHDQIVLDCARYGREETKKKYRLTSNTLDKILRENKQPDISTSSDRALNLALLADERSLEVQRTVNQLKDAYSKFPDLVSQSLAENFFKPLLAHIKIPPELEAKPDERLSLKDVKDLEKLE